MMIAQVSSGFGDFLSQIPLLFILMLCGSGILLLFAAFAIVRARVMRSRSGESTMPQPQARPASANLDTGELPDLDLLVDVPAPPKRSPPPPSSTTTVATSSGPPAHAVEVVTILRDVVDGGLMIQMGDQTVRDLSDDEAFRQRFLKIMRELGPLVRQAQEQVTAEPAPAQAEPTPTQAVEDDLDEAPDLDDTLADITPMPRIDTTPPPPKPDGTMPGDLPKYSLDESPEVVKKRGMLGRTKTEYKPVPEFNIAEAIQDYLQHKLMHTPEFANRSIHVLAAPDGGVNIEVDGTIFEAVGDVSDPEVRAFLTSTIAEWQERNI